MFDIIVGDESESILRVVGVGGAGCNAIEYMIREGVPGVEFICIDKDERALKQSSASTKLLLGSNGPDFVGQQDHAHDISIIDHDNIAEVLRGSHIVFVIAGMGGDTGTGVAPLVAQIARELRILNVAVVFNPFEFQIEHLRVAAKGIFKLAQHANSPIVFHNKWLMKDLGGFPHLKDAFHYVDNWALIAVSSIAGLINNFGLISVDFADLKAVMIKEGRGGMSFATAVGVDRARMAMERAMKSPLLGCSNLSLAKGVLVNITADHSLKLSEIREIENMVTNWTMKESIVVIGTTLDESMEDQLRVTVIATGMEAM